MKRNEHANTIQNENRKNWPRFVVILLISAAVGAVLGYGAAWLGDSVSFASLSDAAGRSVGACAPFAVLPAALFLVPALVFWRQGNGLCAGWDGEDDTVPEQAEQRLNWAILWGNTAQLAGFLLFGVIAALAPLGYVDALALLPAAGEMIALMLAVIALQRRVVDLTRRLNPEKQGSVYDIQFRKKWLASCDEAERQRIGQAAYTSFTVTNYSCLFVWVALVVVNVVVPIGPLPIIAVFIPWALSQLSYLAACIRMEAPKKTR